MLNKVVYQDDESFIEYDPVSQILSVSRGIAHHYTLCAQIFNVPNDKVTWEYLRSIGRDQAIGLGVSRYW